MKTTVLLLLVASLLGAGTVDAQRRGERPTREQMRERLARAQVPVGPEIGVRGLYDFDARDFGVGGQVQIPLTRILRLAPSGEVYFGDSANWQANADVVMSLLRLRAGGGVAVLGRDADDGGGTRDPAVGLNLFAGIQGPPRRGSIVRPFAEARWTFLEEDTRLRLVAGANVRVGGLRR